MQFTLTPMPQMFLHTPLICLEWDNISIYLIFPSDTKNIWHSLLLTLWGIIP